ncbi:hypothetical protein BDZ97DRAFT_259934 [Flammula alnicola]|nr:hypothetical protein BDZ97DRAFT_259934 [Flammula alnicola]
MQWRGRSDRRPPSRRKKRVNEHGIQGQGYDVPAATTTLPSSLPLRGLASATHPSAPIRVVLRRMHGRGCDCDCGDVLETSVKTARRLDVACAGCARVCGFVGDATKVLRWRGAVEPGVSSMPVRPSVHDENHRQQQPIWQLEVVHSSYTLPTIASRKDGRRQIAPASPAEWLRNPWRESGATARGTHDLYSRVGCCFSGGVRFRSAGFAKEVGGLAMLGARQVGR